MSEIMDWNDTIETDGSDYIILDEGDYNFVIMDFERGRFPGSTKIPPCNMAKVFLRIDGGDLGTGLVVENIYLAEKFQWKAAAFLRSIGLKKHGEKVAWRQLVHCDGERGRCHVFVDTFTGKDGSEKQSNKVKNFFDKEEQPPKKAFKKGSF